jgi:hypothetical protein
VDLVRLPPDAMVDTARVVSDLTLNHRLMPRPFNLAVEQTRRCLIILENRYRSRQLTLVIYFLTDRFASGSIET